MIGIKIQNSFWQKALLRLLKDQAEAWMPEKDYQAVVVDCDALREKDFQKKQKVPCIVLGKKEKGAYYLPLPIKWTQLQGIIASLPSVYENDFFVWDSAHRSLKNKKTKQAICLTEKENEFLLFLKLCPYQSASREELLKNVWQYKIDAETHTVESTLYSLRQKLGVDADKLIILNENGYHLV